MRILSKAQNFLLLGPYFQRIFFRPQWPLPIALIRAAVGFRFQSPNPFYTHSKTYRNPHRIPIPTEPRNPPYPSVPHHMGIE